MKFNGIDFNEDWVTTKSLAEFTAHEKHHGLSDEQMKEAYYLIVPKEEPKALPEPKKKKEDANDSITVEQITEP